MSMKDFRISEYADATNGQAIGRFQLRGKI
jgi:hypothetical protein